MARDARATRRRLLDAAADEFAARGLADARVDRIAAAAKANKAQIYHHFGSKERLFDAVLKDIVGDTAGQVPIDAGDLLAYAERLFDRYEADPRIARLAIWHRFERADRPQLRALTATINDELTRTRRGRDTADSADRLNLVLHLSLLWAFVFPKLAPASREHRRRLVTTRSARS